MMSGMGPGLALDFFRIDFSTSTNIIKMSMGDLGGDSKLETAICYLLIDGYSKTYKISVFHNKATIGVMNSASNGWRFDVINVSGTTIPIFCDQDGDKRPTILIP